MEKLELSVKIEQMATSHLSGSTHFVLEVKVIERLNPPRITVIVDGESGITIDDCASLSRALSDSIHESNLLDDYHLEVTTPGIDQPLKLLRQFGKHIGRNVKIELKEKETVRGKLLGLEGDTILIEEEAWEKGNKKEKIQRRITFDQIDKTFVMVSFK